MNFLRLDLNTFAPTDTVPPPPRVTITGPTIPKCRHGIFHPRQQRHAHGCSFCNPRAFDDLLLASPLAFTIPAIR